MSQAHSPTDGRQRLSSKRRTWLGFWSLLRLIILLPLWLFGLVALVLGIALSPWGTDFLLSQGEKRGYFSFESYEGGILENFELRGFSMDVANTQIRIDDLALAWGEGCVLSGRLCLDYLRIDGADIRLQGGEESPQEESSGGMGSFFFPFTIEIRELSIDESSVALADGTLITWQHFSTAATAQGNTVEIAATTLQSPSVYLPPTPGVALTEGNAGEGAQLAPAGIDAAIALQTPTEPVTLAGQAPANANTAASERLELPTIALPVNIALESLTIEQFELQGRFAYQVERGYLAGRIEGSDVTLDALEFTTEDADARLVGSATLDDNYPLDVRLDTTLYLPELFPELNGQRLVLEASGTLDALAATLEASGPVVARLEADVDALASTLPFELSLQSDSLQWPLPTAQAQDGEEQAPIFIDDLALDVSGSLEAYQVSLSGEAEMPDMPRARLVLAGNGDFEHFVWDDLALQVEESRLRSSGRIDWQAPLRVAARVRLDDIDPALVTDAMQGNLSGDIELGVVQQGEQWEIDLPVLAIDGTLQEYPLTLDAALTANTRLEADVEHLRFAQGNNRIEAAGQISQQAMSLNANVALRELRTLHAELGGALTGRIQAAGSIERPQIRANLEGDGLRFADNLIERLSLDANVQGLDDPELDVVLVARNLRAGGQSLPRLDLGLNGRLSQHRLTLDVQGEENGPITRAALALQGRFQQEAERYQARLTPLEVDGEVGNIRLEAPVDVTYNLANGQARITPFCLRREQGGVVCATEAISASAEQGRAALAVREVPMEMVEPFLPEDWQLEGDTTADLVASWSQGGARWQANVQVLSDLVVTAINDYGQPVTLPAISLDAQVETNQARADADVVLSLSEAGNLTLNLGVVDPLGRGVLDGELRANDISLAPYQPMVLQLNELGGDLTGRVGIGGTTAQPDLQGSLGLRNIRVNGPDIPVDIRDGQFVVNFAGEQGQIDGFLAAERGRLNIDGSAYWPSGDDWRIGIDLEAVQEPILAVIPRFGRLEAAPDIRIRINPELLQIRGNVDVPWARLTVGSSPPSAISPSSDEIIITERQDREAERAAQEAAARGEGPSAAQELADTGMEIDMLITVTLGQDMQLSAYGLESGLGGMLEVRQDSGVLQLFGEVNLVDGRFQAFNQDLLIRRGQVLFSGPPGLPTLDFEAIRNPDVTQDDVIAGLRVTGTAEAPNVAIFSEPAMDENRALSYLLRGRAPESGGGVDTALTTALIGMSLGRTGGAVGSIGEAFGIDDLTLDTTGVGDESQVALSGQLTDDLRISYGVGIFSPIAELTLRYTLWRNLYLQAVSGTSQAIDLLYTFTRSGNPQVIRQGQP
ncbi:autotransporter assembly complex protein TamB [Halomonas dongshanensis]|uniref:Translocation/assembly module TamB n=1 Tax=Halomonas dongshanensis TaxID=2890835 RepID=A0ABT2EGC1_9GAMM|nr:translocation/assembly module TamB domain-containing protein [Halomonas dongshanensis]MCS2610615.1 translocation/assembly module TamB [Halomonas dongshanensis]